LAPVSIRDSGANTYDLPGIGILFRAEKVWSVAQIVTGAVRITPTGISGDIHGMVEYPGIGILIRAEEGWFLAHAVDGVPTVTSAGTPDTGSITKNGREFPGIGVLIAAQKGWFVARVIDGVSSINPLGTFDSGNVFDVVDFPNVGLLVRAEKGWFLARATNEAVRLTPVTALDTGGVLSAHNFLGIGLLIRAEKGWFVAKVENGVVNLAQADRPDTGDVTLSTHDFPGVGVLIIADKGLFVARAVNGAITVTPANISDTGNAFFSTEVPGMGVLIAARKGWFVARALNGSITVEFAGAPGTGYVLESRNFPGIGYWIVAANGLFLAHEVNGGVIVTPVGSPNTGRPFNAHNVGGSGQLIHAEKGLFLAREAEGKIALTAVGLPNAGRVLSTHDFPGVGVLVIAEKGWFVARAANGGIAVTPTGAAPDAGGGDSGRAFPGIGLMIRTKKGWFLASMVNEAVKVTFAGVLPEFIGLGARVFPGTGLLIIGGERTAFSVATPLLLARVTIRDKNTLDGSMISKNPLSIAFTIAHECAPVAYKLGLKVPVKHGNLDPTDSPELVPVLTPSTVEVALPQRIDSPGRWSFQVISTSGGSANAVGDPQFLSFIDENWWEQSWKLLLTVIIVLLTLANIAVFIFARSSLWARRLATDDGWGTGVLRVATFLLGYVRAAQLWIIDLYFLRIRLGMSETRPYLPLPIRGSDGRLQISSEGVGPPWNGRRLWVQGGSGMGKTALFRNITEFHFRDNETTYAAYPKWGCILVAFAARDFAGSGEDKDDPAWVIDAVRATLSSGGLTFANTALLTKFVESGTVGVAIDGLNEVERSRGVAAFTRSFEKAPIFVTSQQMPDNDRFTTWRLPTDIRNFTSELLKLYMMPEQAEVVDKRITASGLKDAIRSGYDVRLIIDLSLPDPDHADIPAGRLELYAAVVSAGWPDAPEEMCKEQQGLTAAAAWRMVSERKPNEDMRRLRPDVDLPTNLLVALADAPDKYKRSVRLVRRVGSGAFEFVHDQMHAYLTARWFTQEGFSAAELERMVANLTIWTQSTDARRTLWGFVAALLDDERLISLRTRVVDKEEWDVLRRTLKAEAERRGLRAARVVETEPS
jgi:hypothetical protein